MHLQYKNTARLIKEPSILLGYQINLHFYQHLYDYSIVSIH